MASLSDKQKARTFAEKMRKEGAAGFGAGPWMSWEENGCQEQSIIEGVVVPGNSHKRTKAGPNRVTSSDRLVTWIASLAFITLLVGIAGVYFTADKQTTSAPVVASGNPHAATGDTSSNRREPREPDETTPPAAVSASEVVIVAPSEPDVVALPPTTIDSWTDSSTNTWAVPAEVESSPEAAVPAAVATKQLALPAEPATNNMTTQAAFAPAAETAQLEEPVEPAADNLTTLAPTPAAAAAPEPETVPEQVAGPWQVNIESYFIAKRANRRLAELQALGIDAEQTITEVNGKTVYRLGVAGFKSRKAAEAHGDTLKQQHKLESIWISKK